MNTPVNKSPVQPGVGEPSQAGAAASQTAQNPVKPTEAAKEREYHVFYSTFGSMRMATPTGKPITFVQGQYITDSAEDIEYLQSELEAGNQHIYVKEGEEVQTAADLDPMEALKKKIITDYLEEQAKNATKERDMGSTKPVDTAKLVASTKTVAAVTGNSNSPAGQK